jgi:hypothetical protein
MIKRRPNRILSIDSVAGRSVDNVCIVQLHGAQFFDGRCVNVLQQPYLLNGKRYTLIAYRRPRSVTYHRRPAGRRRSTHSDDGLIRQKPTILLLFLAVLKGRHDFIEQSPVIGRLPLFRGLRACSQDYCRSVGMRVGFG